MPKAKVNCDHMYIDRVKVVRGDIVTVSKEVLDFAGERLVEVRSPRKKKEEPEDEGI